MTAVALEATGAARGRIGELLALNDGYVGASTGYMRAHRGDWPTLSRQALRVSSRSVELSALSAAELPGLIAFLEEHASELPFEYMAVHGPAKGWTGEDRELVTRLAVLPSEVAAVVMHPDTLSDTAAFASLGPRLLLENMNTQKRTGRTATELRQYFRALPEARFCFDIAHAHQCDPTLRGAHELLDAYCDRLAEVHLSSILADGTHISLTEQDVHAFWPVLERCVGTPWILEAILPG